MSNTSVAIVGAGIAGLTAAHTLKKAGLNPVIFEASDRPGGRMYSVQKGEYLFDLGTIALLGGTDILPELINDTALDQHFALADTLIVGIIRNGQIKRIDSTHPIRDFLSTDLLSPLSKLKLVKMVWRAFKHRKICDSENAIGLGTLDTETITQYATRELGSEAADYICSPLTRALWLSDADSHSVTQLMWTLNAMKYPLYTLNTGNGSLPKTLADLHEIRCNHAVTHIETEGQSITLRISNNDKEDIQKFDSCILAVPPPLALQLVPEISGIQRDFFEAAKSTAMLCVHFGLSKRPDNVETVLMYPEKDFNDIACVYVNHNKAPGRAPSGKGSLSAYFTETWCMENMHKTDEELVQLAIERMKPYYENFELNIEETFVNRWPQFVMTLSPGIYKLMDNYQRSIDEKDPSRLQYAGDFMPNPGINQAMASGKITATRILKALKIGAT